MYLVGQPCCKDSIHLSLPAPGCIPRCGLLWKKVCVCVSACLKIFITKGSQCEHSINLVIKLQTDKPYFDCTCSNTGETDMV